MIAPEYDLATAHFERPAHPESELAPSRAQTVGALGQHDVAVLGDVVDFDVELARDAKEQLQRSFSRGFPAIRWKRHVLVDDVVVKQRKGALEILCATCFEKRFDDLDRTLYGSGLNLSFHGGEFRAA